MDFSSSSSSSSSSSPSSPPLLFLPSISLRPFSSEILKLFLPLRPFGDPLPLPPPTSIWKETRLRDSRWLSLSSFISLLLSSLHSLASSIFEAKSVTQSLSLVSHSSSRSSRAHWFWLHVSLSLSFASPYSVSIRPLVLAKKFRIANPLLPTLALSR